MQKRSAIFLLRWGTEWEMLPEGTTLDDAEVAAIRKRRSLSLGEEPKPSAPKPKQKPKSATVQ